MRGPIPGEAPPAVDSLMGTLLVAQDDRLHCPECGSDYVKVDRADVRPAARSGLAIRATGKDTGALVTASPLSSFGPDRRRLQISLHMSDEVFR